MEFRQRSHRIKSVAQQDHSGYNVEERLGVKVG